LRLVVYARDPLLGALSPRPPPVGSDAVDPGQQFPFVSNPLQRIARFRYKIAPVQWDRPDGAAGRIPVNAAESLP